MNWALIGRFLKKIEYDRGCIVWTGAQNSKGYGCVWAGGQSQLAHRVSFWMFVGPFDLELTINHKCRVRTCVNPTHLELMTLAENSSDGARHQWDEWEDDHGF